MKVLQPASVKQRKAAQAKRESAGICDFRGGGQKLAAFLMNDQIVHHPFSLPVVRAALATWATAQIVRKLIKLVQIYALRLFSAIEVPFGVGASQNARRRAG